MLSIQYLPHDKLYSASREERISTMLALVREGSIVIVDGRLDVRDEAALIRETMSSLDDKFCGIEIGFLGNNSAHGLIMRARHAIAHMLVGEGSGLTLIGPANIISELERNPQSLRLHFQKEYAKSIQRRYISTGQANEA